MQRLALLKPAALALLSITVPAVATQSGSPSAPPGFSPIAVSGTASTGPSSAYIRITQPKTLVEVVLPEMPGSAANAPYRVASYSVNCKTRAVKYESVRTVDAASHLSISTLSMPKTVSHQPGAGSVEEGVLSGACRE